MLLPGRFCGEVFCFACSTKVLLQRKDESLGRGLSKTSGWVHRAVLQKKQVEMIKARATTKSTTRVYT